MLPAVRGSSSSKAQEALMDEQILRRLERVERENRYLKLVGLLLIVFLVGVAAVQSGSPNQTLTVQRIVITDANGTNRGLLSADKDGGFLVFQNGGNGVVKLGLVGAEPHLDTPDVTSKTGFRNWLAKGGVIPAR
jgi:hypothetical protein